MHFLVKRKQVILLTFYVLFSFSVCAQPSSPNSVQDERLLQTFEQVYRFIQNNYVDEIDPEVLIDGAMKGMFEALEDPYSVYLDISDMRSLTDTTSGEFGGVGLYINKVRPQPDDPSVRSFVEVVAPIEDTPAYRSGLMPRDLIIEIDGESTEDMSIDIVVSKLRGNPGSTVNLTILRGESLEFPVDLERAMIEIPTVKHEMIGEIGFIRIIQFTPHTVERLEEALFDLDDRGYTSLIIDLRSNPGGLLTAVIESSDLFFDNGLIVGTSGRVASENQQFSARPGKIVPSSMPIVVLINSGTASAAEIMAGALGDRDRAVLLGETTYGKGSVQQVRSLGTTGFRLTMAKYYTPDEVFIDKVGISPDIEMVDDELTEEEQDSYLVLIEEDRINRFLNRFSNPSEAQIRQFIRDLTSDGIVLRERMVRRLLRLELDRRHNRSSVYDLDYDIILQEAVRLIRENEVKTILQRRPSRAAQTLLPEPVMQ